MVADLKGNWNGLYSGSLTDPVPKLICRLPFLDIVTSKFGVCQINPNQRKFDRHVFSGVLRIRTTQNPSHERSFLVDSMHI